MILRVSWNLVLVGLLLAGCASQTASPKAALEQEITALKGQVEELKRNQEATTREFGMIVLDTRSVRESLTQLTKKQEEAERALRTLKEGVDSVSAQLAKLVETRAAPPAPPKPSPQARPSPQAAGADALYRSAMVSYRSRDFYGATSGLLEFLARFPDHQLAENAQQMLGESYYALQEFELALGEFLKLLERDPRGAHVPETLLKVGLSYRALGDAGESRSVWERLIREHPKSAEARRARSLLAEGTRPRR